MSSIPHDSSREERVDEAIAAYLQAVERGENPDQVEFLAAHPDLAAELDSFFINRDCFQQAAGKQGQKPTHSSELKKCIEICSDFERRWRNRQAPRIEECLDQIPDSART